ncbi:DHA2 family efflux MFS transporter permease subunit [Halalkalibacter hemicellulosilyticus]
MPALGPLLSGFILQYFEWRVLFYIVAPIACLTMVIASFVIRDKKEQTNIKLDITSVIFSSLGFGGILYGFSTAGDDGWNHSEVYITILVGLIALIIFIMRQTKQENPMLNFNVFKFPMYSLSIIISMIISMTLFSSMILIPIYFITLRGISTMDAGLMMLPGVLILSIMSPIVGKLFDKMGARILAVTGLFIITVTSYYFSQLTLETTYFQLIFLNTVRSLGIALVMMPVATNGLNQLPERFYPHGTAMNNTMQQISGAIGTALLITIMSIRTEVHASAFEESLLPVVDDQIIILSMLEGINDAFFVTIFFSVIALILAAFFKRSKPEEEIKKINKVENRGESGLVSSK